MYAVIKTGGKQYRVSEGDIIEIEKLDSDEGAAVDFEDILMVGEGEEVKIGTPFIDGCKVTGTITEQKRGKKIEIIKFRRRKHHQKRTGHRQYLTKVEITSISA
ncbi:MAG TPA: 50S ribosomal protein L21 [Thiotrichaceae bacterium]|nr:50S ribosomal protein L21 [Thiotrichaceae bacterium]